jgi:hypothetical protein
MMSRKFEVYKNVLEAMQDAEELGGVEGQDYLDLMEAIRYEAVKRFNNCADNMEVNR